MSYIDPFSRYVEQSRMIVPSRVTQRQAATPGNDISIVREALVGASPEVKVAFDRIVARLTEVGAAGTP